MEQTLTVEKKEIPITRVDKIFYPKTGFTKGEMIDYYIKIAPQMLKHLKGRPVSLKRYPDGVEGLFFYEKQCPKYRPDWVNTAPVWSEQRHANINYCLFEDLPTLVWAANLAVLEIHVVLSKKAALSQPTSMVFDLDPGEGTNIVQCAAVALKIKELFEKSSLESFPKTSGSKGMQLYVPLNSKCNFDETKAVAKHVAAVLEQEQPEHVVSKMAKVLRKGKVFIDWSQNDEHKTTVCVYSMRATETPSVSTPLKWSEVKDAAGSKAKVPLRFEPKEVLARVEKFGDLFEPLLTLKQNLKSFK